MSTWDERLLAWPQAHLLQTRGWGIAQSQAGWRSHQLLVPVEGAAQPLPLSVLQSRRPAALARLGLTRLYVPKGPACAADDEPAWAAVLGALDDLARRAGAGTVTVEPPGWDDQAAALRSRLRGHRWSETATAQPAHTAVVDLSGDFEAVLARMRPKGRYNVRLAARRGVVVDCLGGDAVAAETLAALCAATAARQGIHQPDARHLRAVLATVPGAAVYVASVAGEPVAGALVAAFAGEAAYLYGGSTERHRERQPSALLHAAVMQAAMAAGCRTYDLWGIPAGDDPTHAWHGLRQFKLSLGGVERSAPGAWRQVRRPAAARAGELLENLRRRARRPLVHRERARLEHGGDGERTAAPAPRTH
ncbi:MAG TPA: peptidoglycan bridge formation glycyltransferase FemA/FemB family protein [Candidatus Dormibacteraeota bacterium]